MPGSSRLTPPEGVEVERVEVAKPSLREVLLDAVSEAPKPR